MDRVAAAKNGVVDRVVYERPHPLSLRVGLPKDNELKKGQEQIDDKNFDWKT